MITLSDPTDFTVQHINLVQSHKNEHECVKRWSREQKSSQWMDNFNFLDWCQRWSAQFL